MSSQAGILDFQPSVQTAGVQVWWGVERQTMLLPWQGFKKSYKNLSVDNMQILGNNYQPVQTFCWTETGIFREHKGQADLYYHGIKPARSTKLIARLP